jgi:hypothetical protein
MAQLMLLIGKQGTMQCLSRFEARWGAMAPFHLYGDLAFFYSEKEGERLSSVVTGFLFNEEEHKA